MDAEKNDVQSAVNDPQFAGLVDSTLKGRLSQRNFLVKAGVLGVSAATASAVLAACSAGSSASGTTTASTAGPKKALTSFPLSIFDSYHSVAGLKACYVGADFTNPFGLAQNAFLQQHAEGVGWDFKGFDGQNNSTLQNTYMSDAIAQNYSVIYVNPLDAAGISPYIEQAMKAGIVVMTTELWSLAFPTYGTLIDFAYQGELAGQWLGSHVPKGANVISIVGPLNGAAGIGRKTGVDKACKAAGLNMLVSSDQGGWSQTTSHDLFASMLLKYPKIDGVFCGNDDQGLGIALAAQQAGRRKEMKLVGCDMVKQGQDAVRDGTLDASIGQNYLVQAYVAGGFAEGLRRGGYSGDAVYGPYKVDVYLVNRSNVSTVWQSPY